MNSGAKHEVAVPRTIISGAGVRSVGPTGILVVPTGIGRAPRQAFASIDPAQPNPLYDPSTGYSLIFNIGGKVHSINPQQGEGT